VLIGGDEVPPRTEMAIDHGVGRAALNQNVEHRAVLVDRAPEVVRLAIDLERITKRGQAGWRWQPLRPER